MMSAKELRALSKAAKNQIDRAVVEKAVAVVEKELHAAAARGGLCLEFPIYSDGPLWDRNILKQVMKELSKKAGDGSEYKCSIREADDRDSMSMNSVDYLLVAWTE